MKKLLFLPIFALFALIGCQEKDVYQEPASYNISKLDTNLVYAYMGDTSIQVTVPIGETAIVLEGDSTSTDTLSVTDETKEILASKSAPIYVKYVDKTRAATVQNKLEKKDMFWQVIAFEDSKNGDYDYNDLIVHVKYTISNGKLFIGIHPIAYGGYKEIDLHYKIYKADKQSIIGEGTIEGTKTSLFFNDEKQTYVNTQKYDMHYDGYSYSATFDCQEKSLSNVYAVWYITTDHSDTVYALNKVNLKDLNEQFDASCKPYGLVLSGVNANGYTQTVDGKQVKCGFDWFRYPIECTSLFDCYDIQGWISKGDALENHIYPNAKVFDVLEERAPKNMRIYEVSYPYSPITSGE